MRSKSCGSAAVRHSNRLSQRLVSSDRRRSGFRFGSPGPHSLEALSRVAKLSQAMLVRFLLQFLSASGEATSHASNHNHHLDCGRGPVCPNFIFADIAGCGCSAGPARPCWSIERLPGEEFIDRERVAPRILLQCTQTTFREKAEVEAGHFPPTPLRIRKDVLTYPIGTRPFHAFGCGS